MHTQPLRPRPAGPRCVSFLISQVPGQLPAPCCPLQANPSAEFPIPPRSAVGVRGLAQNPLRCVWCTVHFLLVSRRFLPCSFCPRGVMHHMLQIVSFFFFLISRRVYKDYLWDVLPARNHCAIVRSDIRSLKVTLRNQVAKTRILLKILPQRVFLCRKLLMAFIMWFLFWGESSEMR